MKFAGIPTILVYLSEHESGRALMIMELFDILQVVLFIPLALCVLYLFIFSIAGLCYRDPLLPGTTGFQRIAVLIPAYMEDTILPGTILALQKQNYPPERYAIFLIADSLLPETLCAMRKSGIRVIEVRTTGRTKAKALNLALEHIQEAFDLVLVLDADNVISSGYLESLNNAMQPGVLVLQTRRSPKNRNNALAVLDGISEEINNHIFRKGHKALGFPASLSGSGMVFRFDLFRRMMNDISAVGGMDKEMEMWLLRNKADIGYRNDTLVFDEKTSRPDTFKTQRRRWISAQYHYFGKDFFPAVKALVAQRNLAYFQKMLQMAMPPRSILLLLLPVLGLVSFLIDGLLAGQWLWPVLWVISTFVLITSLLLAIPRIDFNRQLLSAMRYLPKGIYLMLAAFFSIRGANKTFLHTPHTAVPVSPDTFSSHEKV